MSTQKLNNITIAKFEAFLELTQCNYIETNSGHIKYTRCDLRRPIIFQSHINPVPEFILKNNLRVLGYSKKDFFEILNGSMKVERIEKKMEFKLIENK